ncbi:MAG: flavodoxin family protein [Deltaproteobacteria bacterium]|nr:flavodoxin family protein [Deltaproteobacteria bacterium]MBW2216232.1 flavodoxin family protein [Deltaproteobacteria bacterium]
MKIICLLGSPRPKGNSTTVANHFCETAEKLGSQVQTFALNKLSFRGCQGCMTCKTKLDRCVLEDDLTQVLDAIHEADVLVMATPTYFAEISSQLKTFMDRTYSYLASDYLSNPRPSRLSPGKKLVFIQTQGQPEENMFADVFKRYEGIFKWYGFGDTFLIRACGVRQFDDPSSQKEAIKLAEETAKKIVSSP